MRTTVPLKVLGLCILGAASAAGAQPASRAPAADPIDELFSQFSSPGTPGCSVAAAKAGETLLERAYGSANLEHGVANTTATVFEAGSASKQFTAAAILLLAAEGKLALTDDVRKYVPELPAYGDTITIDHLLNHTSGLRDWRFVFGVAGWLPGTRVHSNADALEAVKRQRGLNHRPGAEYAYTNTGYTLAAIIVERVSGKSLAAFTSERIFAPLGMTNTRWRDDFREVVKGRAIAYGREKGRFFQDMPFENAYGAGGLLTTPRDLLIWNAALDSARLGPSVTAQLQEQSVLNDGTKSIYARGLMVERYRGAAEIGHGGITSGYRAFVARYPEHRLSVVVLCNAGYVNPHEFVQRIADQFLPAGAPSNPATLGPATASTPSSATPPKPVGERWQPSPSELAQLSGRYTSAEAGATYIASVENGRLVLRLDGRLGDAHVLAPTYRDQFVFSLGKISFQRGGRGEPTGLEMSVPRLSKLQFTRDERSSTQGNPAPRRAR